MSSYSTLIVAARDSPLSIVQVDEVYNLLRKFHTHIAFEPLYMKTVGDRDLQTSLRSLDKTDFFTREIDLCLLDGLCDIAIHSAKDLPSPFPEELKVVALTKGLNPADALVLRAGESFEKLPSGSRIATSSERREQVIKSIRSDLLFVDIRGTIQRRLDQLFSREVDGVVIAEAALIRLQLTHLNRLILPGETAQGQGQLAVVARADNLRMAELFICIDVRGHSLEPMGESWKRFST